MQLNEDVNWTPRVVTNASWRNEEEIAKEMALGLCFEGRGQVCLDPIQEETCGYSQHSPGEYCPSQYSDKFLG